MKKTYNEEVVEFFPEGAKVRCENEMWGKDAINRFEYGKVESHRYNQHGSPQWLSIRLEDGSTVEYDYRYLDIVDTRQSLVRKLRNQE